MDKLSLVREIRELKNQLAYSKNIGFFFGAGTSCASGIPNIEQLTIEIETLLKDDFAKQFKLIRDDLKTTIAGRKPNIEDILNHIRRIREITGEMKNKECLGIAGDAAKQADI